MSYFTDLQIVIICARCRWSQMFITMLQTFYPPTLSVLAVDGAKCSLQCCRHSTHRRYLCSLQVEPNVHYNAADILPTDADRYFYVKSLNDIGAVGYCCFESTKYESTDELFKFNIFIYFLNNDNNKVNILWSNYEKLLRKGERGAKTNAIYLFKVANLITERIQSVKDYNKFKASLAALSGLFFEVHPI